MAKILKYTPIITETKKAYEKWTIKTHSLKEIEKSGKDYAVIVPKGFVVVDFDFDDKKLSRTEVTQYQDKLIEFLEKLNLNSHFYKTNKGVHAWFKDEKEKYGSNTGWLLPIGLKADYRANEKGLIIVKHKGVLREKIENIDFNKLEKIPYYFRGFLNSNWIDRPDVTLTQEGNRYGYLFKLFTDIMPSKLPHLNDEQLKQSCKYANMFLPQPLSENEIEAIFKTLSTKEHIEKRQNQRLEFEREKSKEKINAKGIYDEDGEILWDNLAPHFQTKFNIVNYNGIFWWHDKGRQIVSHEEIMQLIAKELINAKPKEIQDALKRIEIDLYGKGVKSPFGNIKFKNKALNISIKGEITELADQKAFVPAWVNVDWNPNVNTTYMKKILKQWIDSDAVINDLLVWLGSVFTEFDIQVFLTLEGYKARNGKTTLLELMSSILGDSCFESKDIDNIIKEQFGAVNLVGKRLVVIDELDPRYLTSPERLKSYISHSSMNANRKFLGPLKFISTAKWLFTTNELPRTSDTSNGWLRRLLIVGFNKHFANNNEFKEMLFKQENKEALVFLAVNAFAQFLASNKTFNDYMSAESRKVVDEYETMNNTVKDFYLDKGPVWFTQGINSQSIVFKAYVDWCEERKEKPKKHKDFIMSIDNSKWSLVKSHRFTDKRGYRLKIDTQNQKAEAIEVQEEKEEKLVSIFD